MSDKTDPTRYARTRSAYDLVERHAALTKMVERDRESAWQIAHYERGQRDEYTSKLRFGLATLNAASLVTVLNLGGALSGIWPGAALVAAAIYFVGTVSAGRSLVEHQTRLIELVGDTNARALTLDYALSLCAHRIDTPENDRVGPALETAHAYAQKTYSLSLTALNFQHFSGFCWSVGAGFLGFAKVASLYHAPTWAPWLAMG